MYIVRKTKNSKPENITCGIMRKLTDSKDFSGMDIVNVTIKDPTKEHYHKTITEVYYVLKGKVKVKVDGKTEELREGEMIMIFPNTKHKAWKTTKNNAEILVICSPPWTEEEEIIVE